MLLHRKSLAFVAPSDEKYLAFMLLKVHKRTAISPAKNYKNSLKACFSTMKETALAPFNLPHPVVKFSSHVVFHKTAIDIYQQETHG